MSVFQKWWKPNSKVAEHEECPQHFSFIEKWTPLSPRLKLNKKIDHVYQEMVAKEKMVRRDMSISIQKQRVVQSVVGNSAVLLVLFVYIRV